MNISQKIYNLRKENGYSQDELAEKLKVPSRYIAYWEDGVTPELSVVVQLSDIFNVSTDYLLKDDTGDSVTEKVDENEEDIEETQQTQEVQTDDDIVRAYIDKTSGAEDISTVVMCILLAIIPLANYDFNIFAMLNLTEGTLLKICGIIVSGFFGLGALGILYGEEETEEQPEENNAFLDNAKEYDIKCMYRDFKNENIETLVTAYVFAVTMIILAILFASFDPFYERDFLDFILIDVVLFIFSVCIGSIVTYKCKEKVYKQLLEEVEFGETEFREIQNNNVAEEAEVVEVQQVKKAEEMQEAQKKQEPQVAQEVHKAEEVQESATTQKVKSKRGIKVINSTEVDEYISGSIRCGKNHMGLPIFVALGITPYLMSFYSYGKIFNGEVFDAIPIFILIISVIGDLVALYLIIKTEDFNAEFKNNNNYDFILNQFAENKLKFMYEKFKTKRIGKIILSSVIYLIAIVSNIYLCFMFNGSINMLYILLSITVFLYGLATYIVLNIKYEQKAYKVLLTNVD